MFDIIKLVKMEKVGGQSLSREKLLEVAERLFAEKGYKETTIREITREAKCNIASVNYHFGSKKNLYLAVFKERFLPRARLIRETFYKLLEEEKEKTSEAVIRAFAKAFFLGPIPREERILSHRLVAREMNQPSEAFNLILKELFEPFFHEIITILSEFFPEKEKLRLAVLSIHAQVLYFNFNRLAVEHFCKRKFDEKFLNEVIEHIVKFSLEGIKGV